MSGNHNHNTSQGKQKQRTEKQILVQVDDGDFKRYIDEVSKHLSDGVNSINIYGVGNNIPTAIRVAETFVQRKQAEWEKLHTNSLDKQNGSKGKKVCVNAWIRNTFSR